MSNSVESPRFSSNADAARSTRAVSGPSEEQKNQKVQQEREAQTQRAVEKAQAKAQDDQNQRSSSSQDPSRGRNVEYVA